MMHTCHEKIREPSVCKSVISVQNLEKCQRGSHSMRSLLAGVRRTQDSKLSQPERLNSFAPRRTHHPTATLPTSYIAKHEGTNRLSLSHMLYSSLDGLF